MKMPYSAGSVIQCIMDFVLLNSINTFEHAGILRGTVSYDAGVYICVAGYVM